LHATKPIYFALISPDIRYSGPGTEVPKYSSGPGYGMPAGVPQEGLGGWVGGRGGLGGEGEGPPPSLAAVTLIAVVLLSLVRDGRRPLDLVEGVEVNLRFAMKGCYNVEMTKALIEQT
jgi:hypothetical protein